MTFFHNLGHSQLGLTSHTLSEKIWKGLVNCLYMSSMLLQILEERTRYIGIALWSGRSSREAYATLW
jgi:hypothetical protein